MSEGSSDQPEKPNPVKDAVSNAEVFDATVPILDRRILRVTNRRERDGDLDLGCAKLAKNDIGNAERFLSRYGDDFIHVTSLNWHVWTGTHWSRKDGQEHVSIAAAKTSFDMKHEADAILAAGQRPQRGRPGDPDYRLEESAKEFSERHREHRQWALGSGNVPRIRSMIEIAANLKKRSIEELDARPWLFNVANGTLELRAEADGGIRLREHRREDLITHCCDVHYDPTATCPVFDAFLERVQPNHEVRAFLLTLLGYTRLAQFNDNLSPNFARWQTKTNSGNLSSENASKFINNI